MLKFFSRFVILTACAVASLFAAPRAPERIVSLTPSITRQLYELGVEHRVIGITTFCPRANQRQTVVGTYLQPSIERIVAVKPDIVLISKEGASPEIAAALAKFGIPLRAFDPVNSWDALVAQTRALADLVGARDAVGRLEREARDAAERATLAGKAPTVVPLIGLDPLVAASRSSYIGAVVVAAGGRVVVDTAQRYPVLNAEEMARLDPEIILIADMGTAADDLRRFERRFRRLRAVRHGAVRRIDPDMLCQPTLGNWRRAVMQVREALFR